jgi:hypothetical protein
MEMKRGLGILLGIAAMLLWANTVWGAGGDQLWERQINFPAINAMAPSVKINAIIASSTSVIVCGGVGVMSSNPSLGFIKAFDVMTGILKWEYNLDLSVDPMDTMKTNNFSALSMEGGILLATGNASFAVPPTIDPPSPGGTKYVSLIVAFNPDTSQGQPLWQVKKDYYPGMTTGLSSPIPLPLTVAANNRVFLAVNDPPPSNPDPNAPLPGSTCTVRAFQVKNAVMVPTLLLEN